MPNKDLLRATLAHIEANPAEWDQRHWRCGTGMCFAGHAARLARATWLTGAGSGLAEYVVPVADDDELDVEKLDEGVGIQVSFRAARILDLDWVQEDALFKDSNTLDDLRRIVRELCEEGDDEHA